MDDKVTIRVGGGITHIGPPIKKMIDGKLHLGSTITRRSRDGTIIKEENVYCMIVDVPPEAEKFNLFGHHQHGK